MIFCHQLANVQVGDVMSDMPLSPQVARIINEGLQLIVQGGSPRQETGPTSSKESTHSQEVTSARFPIVSTVSSPAKAQAVGKPLKFDVTTTEFELMKYAAVQVELVYSTPRPDYVRINILNYDGDVEKVQVAVIYLQLPYSCSLCQGFGHYLSRYSKNPDATKPAPRATKESSRVRNELMRTSPRTVKESMIHPPSAPTDPVGDKSVAENYVDNFQSSEVPYVIGQLFGCDVVLDEDHTIEHAHACMNENDALENLDTIAPTTLNDTQPLDIDYLMGDNNCFSMLGQLEGGEITSITEEAMSRSLEKSSNRKCKKGKTPKVSEIDHILTIELGAAMTLAH
ncbi:hypothetical protein AgCh_038239 [Apium graveolens]